MVEFHGITSTINAPLLGVTVAIRVAMEDVKEGT